MRMVVYTQRDGVMHLKFLGVNLFMPQKHIQPVQGFTYQHGAVNSIMEKNKST